MDQFARNLLFLTLLFLHSHFIFGQQSEEAFLAQTAIDEETISGESSSWDNGTNLPAVIKSEEGEEFIIAVNELVLTPGGSYLNATSAIEVPFTGSSFGFKGEHISIEPGGIKNDELARIELDGDHSVRLNNNVKITLTGSQGNSFVEFDCNGVSSIGFQGEFEFCRNLLIPENPDGSEAAETERVKADFQTSFSNWDNFLCQVNFTPFQIPNLSGFGFTVTNAWVDLSESANPSQVIFPPDYFENNLSSPIEWKGFFLKELQVKLPTELSGEGGERKSIALSNTLIDSYGFTGEVSASNILPLNEGSINDWPFSIDSIAIHVRKNTLSGGGFSGKISLPIADDEHPFTYTAIFSNQSDYLFRVLNRENLRVPLWSAHMTLAPASALQIAKVNNSFSVSAILHGELSFAADLNGGSSSSISGIGFENLRVSSESPYIHSGIFSFEGNKKKLAGFSIALNRIGIVTTEQESGVFFDISVHLMNADEGGFSGNAAFAIYGEREIRNNGKKRWKYSRTELSQISVEVKGDAYEFIGSVTLFKNNSIYGNGFRGKVSAKFKPGIAVDAVAQFGKVNDYRYWYVDASVQLPTGIPIFSGFGIYGFGGGAYYHMSQARFSDVSLTNDISDEAVPTSGVVDITPPPSGVEYVPDNSITLGLKASVIVGTHPKPDPFNGSVTFEIAFNGTGISYINFIGDGKFMNPLESPAENAKIRATIDLSFDFDHDILHGVSQVYVNFPNVVVGMHPGNLAGQMELHVEKNTWHLHLGTPDKRIALNIINMVTIESYLVMGSSIPPMPPLPAHIASIIPGGIESSRSPGELSTGRGFAFGANLDINTGRKKYLFFYGEFSSGGGFDIMLKDYGRDNLCAGRSGPIGINGWYASGQAYMYLQGAIGIEVDLLTVKGEFEILEIGAAAVMQAKLPNPSFLKGVVGGHYSILNGLVKGNCRFEVTVGEQCTPISPSPTATIQIISSINPGENESSVNVFSNPQVAFNLPMEEAFMLEDANGITKNYRVKFNHFKVQNGSTEIAGELEWNDSKDVVIFKSHDILPGEKTLTLNVKATFEYLQNDKWVTVITNQTPAVVTKEYAFTTGKEPDYIPLSNLDYSYPQPGQFNYYKSQHSQGYIKLKKGQPGLLAETNGLVKKVKFSGSSDFQNQYINYSYIPATKRILFNLPNSSFQNVRNYSISIISYPENSSIDIDENVSTQEEDVESDGSLIISNQAITSAHISSSEKELLKFPFRTSQYNTFSAKVKALNYSEGYSKPLYGMTGLHELGIYFRGEEGFDKYEIENEEGNALIQLSADGSNRWYNKLVGPLIYEPYPFHSNINISHRPIDFLGIPPFKAVDVTQESYHIPLISGETVRLSQSASNMGRVVFKLPYEMYQDYYELQQKCASVFSTHQPVTESAYKLLTSPFPSVLPDNYNIYLNYVLPGENAPLESFKIKIKNP